ncbi:IS200/IS605 family transposase [Candidatus Venteria ishoeyi]|uniref:IS200/IS605 family transposase n=1 Tax=Candidatus Venteria ishoeyi TaxID=1899563 RepID=UPI0025A56550|nr:IS200/IS605 family transposase [Candidatus Venteria ishoeyi]MDM8548384.1 IS200/IS605 family transposase [Candidatus Venteria ishoeyi]
MPQSLSNILLHIVFSTKNRTDLILPAIETELYAYMAEIYRNESCPALIINGTTNHVHSLCRLERTVSVAHLLEQVKKGTSKWVKTKGSEFSDFTWQTGYGAFSIGASNIQALTAYIHNQKQHHQTLSFEDEYRVLLKKYDVTFDERYVWD